MKYSSEVYIVGIVLFVYGFRFLSESKSKSSSPTKFGDDLDFMGRDDYFADMAGGMNVFAKGSNIQNDDFVLTKKSRPSLNTLPRKVKITNKTESI